MVVSNQDFGDDAFRLMKELFTTINTKIEELNKLTIQISEYLYRDSVGSIPKLEKEFYDVKESAVILKLSEYETRRRCREGLILAERKMSSGHYWISREELIRILTRRNMLD